MKEHREIVGDRKVTIFPGYHEWLIQVSTAVIATINGNFDKPPTGDTVIVAIKDQEPTVVVSEQNNVFCDNEQELKYALFVLNSLTEQEYSKIELAWDNMMNKVYRR